MRVILVRHAKAQKPNDSDSSDEDAQRPLTSRGIKKFKKAAKGLANLAKPDVTLSSPTARALGTAQLLEWDAGWPAAVADEALDDHHSVQHAVNLIARLKNKPKPKSVAVVGHGEKLQALADHLLGKDGTPGNEHLAMLPKGGSLSIRIPRSMKPGMGQLEWVMSQKELRRHA